MTIQNLLIDLDDTLISTSTHYIEKQTEFVKEVSERTRIPADICLQIFKDIDLASTKLDTGFSKTRFPRSMAATSAVLDIVRGYPVNDVAAQDAFRVGDSVFDAEYEFFNGVESCLEDLCQRYNMYLWTKGDLDVQWNKILKNDLTRFFPAKNIHIVQRKTPDDLFKILSDNFEDPHIAAKESILIGDSLKDDIYSAKCIGMANVLIKHPDTQGWASYNNSVSVTPTWTIPSFLEINRIL